MFRSFIVFVFGIVAFCGHLSYAGPVRECVVETYRSQVGVLEATGKNDGPEVEMYLRSVGLGKGYPWCGAFCNWVMKRCGADKPKSGAWSPSWFPESRIIVKGARVLKTPGAGDLFGLYYNRLGRIGHVGFVDRWPPGKYLYTIEGNTNNAGSRDGDGVYRKIRAKDAVSLVSRWVDYEG